MPATKAASLIGVAVRHADSYATLEAALRGHLLNLLGGDPYRDINHIDVEVHPDGRVYRGYWNVQLRLSAGVIVDPADIAKVYLIATKGGLSADENCYFKAGPDIGNSVLVARLLHVAVFALKSSGIVEVTNDPIDPRVRQHYTDMGFYNGERLPLTDLAALTKTFTFVEVAYQHPSVSGRLSLASPPP